MILQIKPADLKLPRKFTEFREHQVVALEKIAACRKKVILCQAPPGSGKTLLMAAMGRYLKKRMVYTCHTKQLQQQVVRDFEYGVELKGRSNYICLKDSRLTCNECTKERGNKRPSNCQKCGYVDCLARPTEAMPKPPVEEECPCEAFCPYQIQKRAAVLSELAILNMPFFLNEANGIYDPGKFSGWPMVILDEGDLTENSLKSYIEVAIPKETLKKLRLEAPRHAVEKDWLKWVDELAVPVIEDAIEKLEAEDEIIPFNVKERKNLERLCSKLKFFTYQDLRNWVFLPDEESLKWKPIFIDRYAGDNLWSHGERFLLMSGTILSARQTARDLGLSPDEVDYVEVPSVFAAERRPLYFIRGADMTHKTKDTAWPQVLQELDSIIDDHPYDKGLVHTVSYPLARYVFSNSRNQMRLVQHDPAGRISTLERFKTDPRPLVMISPSMERGVDLPDDLCRFIVILKVPYLNLGDPQVARRLRTSDGAIWYAVQAIRALIQMSGRGMRSAEDFCECYILDEQFGRIFHDYYGYFPDWWKEALKPPPKGQNHASRHNQLKLIRDEAERQDI